MHLKLDLTAWLETRDREQIPVHGLCTFGRSTGNAVVLDAPHASGRHAMIHEQDGEFWIVDLGSAHGIQINGQRVIQPVRLRSDDSIQMPSASFTFRQLTIPAATPEELRQTQILRKQLTSEDIRLMKCWILVADLQGFAQRSRQVPAEELAPMVGKWMAHCQEILQDEKGVLAKFLGDGFLAYWPGRDENASAVASACREFAALQKTAALPFRITVHYGVVSFGGNAPDASHTMIGTELNFAFRLEKVASGLKLSSIFSEAAASRLQVLLPLTSCGEQTVPDFAHDRVCFTLAA